MIKKQFILYLYLFALLSIHKVKSQNEYLVTVDPSSCSINLFDSVPGVAWIGGNSSALDENHHYYFFVAKSFNGTSNYLYTMNTLNGNVVYNPKIHNTTDSLLIGLQYDNNSDTLYGILEVNSLQTSFFVWIDYVTGFIHTISGLPGQYFTIGCSTYDKNHHFYFYADGPNQYVLNARTGSVIFSYPMPQNYLLEYNSTNDKLYGLKQPTSGVFQFDSITVSTGTAHAIATMPFNSIVGMPLMKALDEVHNRYFCVGLIGSNYMLYSIDILTGSVISNPTDPYVYSNNNLIEFKYDNVLDTLFALHWGTSTSNGILATPGKNVKIDVYPNPSENIITITSSEQLGVISIYDLLGVMVLEYKKSEHTKQQIDISQLPAGIYIIQASAQKVKFIKE